MDYVADATNCDCLETIDYLASQGGIHTKHIALVRLLHNLIVYRSIVSFYIDDAYCVGKTAYT